MVVGFVHLYGYGLGDNVIAMEAIYALKQIHPNAKVVLFGVGGAMERLVSQVDFVDEYHSLEGYLPEESLPKINKYTYDCIIITKFYSHIFPLLPRLNASKIIIACKGANVLLPLLPKYRHIRLVPMRNLLLQKVGIRAHCLKMVRAMDKKSYDERIKDIDFDKARVKTTQENKEFVDEFLRHSIGSSIDTSENLALILVNPFSIMCGHTLSLDGYFRLMRAITTLNPKWGGGSYKSQKTNALEMTKSSQNHTNTNHKTSHQDTAPTQAHPTKQCPTRLLPLVITYPKVHSEFITQLEKQDDLYSSVLVFKNNDDLLNLAEMICRCSVVISPSTGIIHLSSNLGISTIGLYERSESKKWSTKDNRYVFLKSPKSNLTRQEENLAIAQSIDLLKQILES